MGQLQETQSPKVYGGKSLVGGDSLVKLGQCLTWEME